MNKQLEYRECPVIAAEWKYGGYLELEIKNRFVSRTAKPGNFVMIRGWKDDSPILPRPFDILEPSPENESFKLVIKITGEGTRRLAEIKPEEKVFILGPLGKEMEIPAETEDGRPVRDIGFLGRGVGAAALVLPAFYARERGLRVHTFITASEEQRLVCADYLEKYSDTFLTGWDSGKKGTGEGPGTDGRDLVRDFLSENSLDVIYTCGSRRFGLFVQDLDRTGTVRGYLFMEERMACGMGDCHGCAVTTPEGDYLLVCQNGPVFPAGMIKL